MHKIWLIIMREYITRVRRPSFVLLTLLTPVGMATVILLPLLLFNLDRETQRILVLDESGLFSDLRDTTGIYFSFDQSGMNRDSLEDRYEEMGYTAFLYIPRMRSGEPRGLELLGPRQISMATKYYVESVLESSMERINLQRLGLEPLQHRIRPNIDLETGITGKGRHRQQGNAFAATVVGYIMGFSIYVVLLIYGTMVMRGVVEEKSNRIVEVIITSVKPFQLMMGKILGIGAVGLTQFSVWLILGAVVQALLGLLFAEEMTRFQLITRDEGLESSAEIGRMARAYAGFQGLPLMRLFAVFGFYFLGGYLLYSSLFAAVGALTNDDGGDSQLYVFPVTLPIILSIILMIFVIQHPNSRMAFWASIIPLSSPIVMPARMPFIGVFNEEVALSMGLLVLGFIGSTALAARIYRTGILLYGKKIRPLEVWRWLWHR